MPGVQRAEGGTMTPHQRLAALSVSERYHLLREPDGAWWAWVGMKSKRIPSRAVYLGKTCEEALIALAVEIGEGLGVAA